MVVLEDHVLFISKSVTQDFKLIEAGWNVAEIVQVLRSDLADVQINQVGVVSVYLVELVFS